MTDAKPNPNQCKHCGRSHGRRLWITKEGRDYVKNKSRKATGADVERGKDSED